MILFRLPLDMLQSLGIVIEMWGSLVPTSLRVFDSNHVIKKLYLCCSLRGLVSTKEKSEDRLLLTIDPLLFSLACHPTQANREISRNRE